MTGRRRARGPPLALVGGARARCCRRPRRAPRVTLTPVITGLSSPVFVTGAGDGTNRLFVVEQTGRVKVVKNGVDRRRSSTSARRSRRGGERGLLGLAFHPNYETNRKFYVYFTLKDGDIGINEYKASAIEPERGDPLDAPRILTIGQPNSNHNGGMLAFGQDGYLYIGVGDGGGAGDVPGNRPEQGPAARQDAADRHQRHARLAQRTGSRSRTRSSAGPGATRSGRYGLRNPWRFSFDRVRGDIWIGDVGQNRYEEIDRKLIDLERRAERPRVQLRLARPRGLALLQAGQRLQQERQGPTRSWSTRHGERDCSVTGGYVYRGSTAALVGKYVFADFCSGEIWSVHRGRERPARQDARCSTPSRTSARSGRTTTGELYVVVLTAGRSTGSRTSARGRPAPADDVRRRVGGDGDRLLDRDLDVELDLVADQPAAGLEGDVPVEAPVLAVDLRAVAEKPAWRAPSIPGKKPRNSTSKSTGRVTSRIVTSAVTT